MVGNIHRELVGTTADTCTPTHHLNRDVVVVVQHRMHTHTDLTRLRARLVVDLDFPVTMRTAVIGFVTHTQVRGPSDTELRARRTLGETHAAAIHYATVAAVDANLAHHCGNLTAGVQLLGLHEECVPLTNGRPTSVTVRAAIASQADSHGV